MKYFNKSQVASFTMDFVCWYGLVGFCWYIDETFAAKIVAVLGTVYLARCAKVVYDTYYANRFWAEIDDELYDDLEA